MNTIALTTLEVSEPSQKNAGKNLRNNFSTNHVTAVSSAFIIIRYAIPEAFRSTRRLLGRFYLTWKHRHADKSHGSSKTAENSREENDRNICTDLRFIKKSTGKRSTAIENSSNNNRPVSVALLLKTQAITTDKWAQHCYWKLKQWQSNGERSTAIENSDDNRSPQCCDLDEHDLVLGRWGWRCPAKTE